VDAFNSHIFDNENVGVIFLGIYMLPCINHDNSISTFHNKCWKTL